MRGCVSKVVDKYESVVFFIGFAFTADKRRIFVSTCIFDADALTLSRLRQGQGAGRGGEGQGGARAEGAWQRRPMRGAGRRQTGEGEGRQAPRRQRGFAFHNQMDTLHQGKFFPILTESGLFW